VFKVVVVPLTVRSPPIVTFPEVSMVATLPEESLESISVFKLELTGLLLALPIKISPSSRFGTAYFFLHLI